LARQPSHLLTARSRRRPPTPNPRLSLPAGSLPKPLIPLPPHLAAATDDSQQQVLVFAVDASGVLKTVVKQPDSTLDPTAGEPDGFWGAAFGLSGAIFPPGAPLAAIYHPTSKAIDVFGVDSQGTLQDVRREKLTFGTPFWQSPVPLSGPGFAAPGAPVAAVWQPLNDQLEVYGIAVDRARAQPAAHNLAVEFFEKESSCECGTRCTGRVCGGIL
jgi:hypothetical protein